MTSTVSTPTRGGIRSEVLPWAILVLAAAFAGFLYGSAETTTREARRAVGNGIGTYTSVSTTRSAGLSIAAGIVLSTGLATWAVLLSRKTRGRLRWAPPLIAILAMVATAWVVVASLPDGESFADFEHYPNAAALTGAMRDGGDECAATSSPPGAERRGLYRERIICRLPSLADIRDGHDDVAIDFFVDDSARNIWTESVDHDDAFAVIGPDWAITCEFQSTCARLQNTIGGRNY